MIIRFSEGSKAGTPKDGGQVVRLTGMGKDD